MLALQYGVVHLPAFSRCNSYNRAWQQDRVSSHNAVTRTRIAIDERNQILIEKLGISQDLVNALPPDDPDYEDAGITPAE